MEISGAVFGKEARAAFHTKSAQNTVSPCHVISRQQSCFVNPILGKSVTLYLPCIPSCWDLPACLVFFALLLPLNRQSLYCTALHRTALPFLLCTTPTNTSLAVAYHAPADEDRRCTAEVPVLVLSTCGSVPLQINNPYSPSPAQPSPVYQLTTRQYRVPCAGQGFVERDASQLALFVAPRLGVSGLWVGAHGS